MLIAAWELTDDRSKMLCDGTFVPERSPTDPRPGTLGESREQEVSVTSPLFVIPCA